MYNWKNESITITISDIEDITIIVGDNAEYFEPKEEVILTN